MKRSTAFLSLILLITGIQAQRSLELVTLAGTYGFPSAYESPYDDQKVQPLDFLANIKAPAPFTDNFAWFTQITYTMFHVDNDIQMPPEIANPLQLHSFIMQTGPSIRFGNKLESRMFGSGVDQGLLLFFAPRFMTDFNNAGSKNFQFGGVVLYQKIFSERLFMRIGGMYHQELGGPYLVPIVETDWIISDKWSLVGQWPITGKLNYHINDKFTTGISHFGLITSYYLGDPDYEGDYIERTSIDLALFGRMKVAGGFHVEGRFGYALGRSYKQFAADETVPFRVTILSFGPEREMRDHATFDPGLIFNLRLVYDLKLK